MVKIVNLTPHTLNMYPVEGDEPIATYDSEGVARVSVNSTPVAGLGTDTGVIPVMEREFGEVEGLPAPKEGHVFVVSSLVQGQVPHRRDVLSPDTGPGSVVRDENGRIIGVRRFTKDAPSLVTLEMSKASTDNLIDKIADVVPPTDERSRWWTLEDAANAFGIPADTAFREDQAAKIVFRTPENRMLYVVTDAEDVDDFPYQEEEFDEDGKPIAVFHVRKRTQEEFAELFGILPNRGA